MHCKRGGIVASKSPPSTKDKLLRCSFCGLSNEEVKKLCAGPGVYICNECIDLCNEIIRDGDAGKPEEALAGKIPHPHEIVAELDKYVIGQPEAKRTLAVEVVNHFKRLRHNAAAGKNGDVLVEKSNVLVIGPTGSGKTLLANSLAKILDVPFVEFDATEITESGYVGSKPEDIIIKLLIAAGGDKEKAEKGIVFLDEVDKLAKPPGTQIMGIDVSRDGAQKGLVRLIEGKEISVSPNGRENPPVMINTSNILFICGGAFEGLWKNIDKRLNPNKKPPIGFEGVPVSKNEELTRDYHLLHFATPKDIEEYGMKKEITGRIPIITAVNELSIDDLLRILTEPKSALLKQYNVLKPDGVELEITIEAQRVMAHGALKRGTGGRYLRTAISEMTQAPFYDVPKYNIEHPDDPIVKVVIDLDSMKTKLPKYIYKSGQNK